MALVKPNWIVTATDFSQFFAAERRAKRERPRNLRASSEPGPVLIGPGDGENGSDPGFYWQTDPNIPGWIIADAQLWGADTGPHIELTLDAVIDAYNVEGEKFHAVCWSANSAGIFRLVTANADRFHSITGMAGNPGGVDSVYEVVPNGEHVMTNLIGAPFIQKLEKLR